MSHDVLLEGLADVGDCPPVCKEIVSYVLIPVIRFFTADCQSNARVVSAPWPWAEAGTHEDRRKKKCWHLGHGQRQAHDGKEVLVEKANKKSKDGEVRRRQYEDGSRNCGRGMVITAPT